jgi:hypothetical protein
VEAIYTAAQIASTEKIRNKTATNFTLTFEPVRDIIVIRYQNIVHFRLEVDDAQNHAIALP